LVGLAISMWPDVIPGRLSLWDAAAPESSQIFMLVGSAILVPMILSYTGWAYWVFRGNVDAAGYHCTVHLLLLYGHAFSVLLRSVWHASFSLAFLCLSVRR